MSSSFLQGKDIRIQAEVLFASGGRPMPYVSVTILHQPDAGRQTSSHFSYHEPIGHTDVVTARDFAFKAISEGDFQKGMIKVVFPQRAPYAFRFERMGLMGYNLIQTQELPEEGHLV
jgi:hypothetical protein